MAIVGLWRRRGGGAARHAAWPGRMAALRAVDGDGPAATSPDAPDAPDAPRRSGASPSEPADFEAFFREHERAVYACLWRLTGDPQTARDLAQEAFLRAWRHFERVRAYEQPRAWLLRVATNLALTARRRDRARPLSADALPDT